MQTYVEKIPKMRINHKIWGSFEVVFVKKIEAYIRTEKIKGLITELNRHQIFGMSLSNVVGSGQQPEVKHYYRGILCTKNTFDRVKLELVVKDSWVDEVVEVIMLSCRTGSKGDGKIFVYNVEKAYRIRDGKKDDEIL